MASNAEHQISIICDLYSISDNETDSSSENAFSYYVSGPVLTAFIILGIFANSACLYVFRPRAANITPTIYIYLFALALWDLALLSSSFLLYSLPELTHGSVLTNPNYVVWRPYIYCITNAAHTSANWVVVALGCERYIALCYPFKHRMLSDSRRRAVYVVVIISLAGVLYSLPRLFELLYENNAVPECVINDDDEDIIWQTASEHTTVRKNVIYRFVYKIVGGALLYSVGPFLCLLIVSIRVSAAIRQQRSFQRESRQENKVHRRSINRDQLSYRINIMLISVVVKLLFVHALATCLDLAEVVMGDENFLNDHTIEYLLNFLTLLLAINSICNFIIYYVCSVRFRNELKKVFNLNCASSLKGGRKNWRSNPCQETYGIVNFAPITTATTIHNEHAYDEGVFV